MGSCLWTPVHIWGSGWLCRVSPLHLPSCLIGVLCFSDCFGFFGPCALLLLRSPPSSPFLGIGRLASGWLYSRIPSSAHLQIWSRPAFQNFLSVSWLNDNQLTRLHPVFFFSLIFSVVFSGRLDYPCRGCSLKF